MSTAQPYPRRKWTLTVLCLSLLVISLDNTILNTALPRLARDLHATDSQLQWIVDSYMLVFAARRLQADEVALLFAVRDGTHQFPAGGLSELSLRGVDTAAAQALIDERSRELPPALRRRLISEAAGNPLALIELPRALADPDLHLAGASSAALPLTEELQRAFLARVSTLPPEAQTLLLVAACDEGRELASVQRAARALGVDDHAIAIAERAALLSVSKGEIRFRHRLVRSAVYQHATETERHRAHRALADALDAPDQADRRAWHRTLASLEIVVARSVITRHSRPRSR